MDNAHPELAGLDPHAVDDAYHGIARLVDHMAEHLLHRRLVTEIGAKGAPSIWAPAAQQPNGENTTAPELLEDTAFWIAQLRLYVTDAERRITMAIGEKTMREQAAEAERVTRPFLG
jgi:hypothetical protein